MRIAQNRLDTAPAVALVASFAAVFALGKLLASDGDSRSDPPITATAISGTGSGDMTVIKEPDGLRIELHHVRAKTSSQSDDVDATITDGRHRDLVQVCLTLPGGMKIADQGWSRLSDPTPGMFCKYVLQGRDVQVRLEQM